MTTLITVTNTAEISEVAYRVELHLHANAVQAGADAWDVPYIQEGDVIDVLKALETLGYKLYRD